MTKLEVFCDEAGHTGPQLLNLDQKIFAYASVAVPNDEAAKVIAEVRGKFRLQMPELKGTKLIKSGRGRAAISSLLTEIDGRYAVNAHDKLLALCGWVFEYIYEPVFNHDQRLLRILYQMNFHRFVAMFSYLWFQDMGSRAPEAISQFEAYMRSRNEADAPLLFETIDNDDESPFSSILKFARGYRELIVSDNSNLDVVLPDQGAWVLDLSTSSLWSHLNHWGLQKLPIKVICDHSKPLEASVGDFSGDEHSAAMKRIRDICGHSGPLGWTLDGPVLFSDSHENPSIQLADVVASTVAWLCSNRCPNGFQDTAALLDKHMLRDSIFPDNEILNIEERGPCLNWLLLFHLSERAAAGISPFQDLEAFIQTANQLWEPGVLNQL
ncbi:hypothetical protein MACH10_23700 [Thalassospira tepidiphila]|uniref:DUF3800 domain-containing protein n=1 Tax=Thalassospira tepidiphila TaxID=393657 RepID=UPI00292163A8|nr:hypothetical protein MACH10_23700 [Thalassospira tepidiphila]